MPRWNALDAALTVTHTHARTHAHARTHTRTHTRARAHTRARTHTHKHTPFTALIAKTNKTKTNPKTSLE